MTSWMRPVKISVKRMTCIHMTNSISWRGIERGILCHPLQVARSKPCKLDHIRSGVSVTYADVWQKKEVMELGEICSPTFQVPHYPWKSNWMWESKYQYRIKSLIAVEWHQVWQVVHSSHHSKGKPRQVWEGFWCSWHLSHIVYQWKRIYSNCSLIQSRPAKKQKSSINNGTAKGKIELKNYSNEEYDSMSTVQWEQLYEFQKKAGHIKGKKIWKH